MRITFLIIGIITACISCAQQKTGITKTYAFKQLRFTGNMPVDNNGNPEVQGPDTVLYIYIETTGTAPEWKKAVINGKAYTTSAALISPVPVEIGKNEQTGRMVVIGTGKNSQLWQITLSSREGQPVPQLSREMPGVNEIMLEGNYRGKPFRKLIKGAVTLLPRESV